jgi:hypothetical protein
MSALKINPGEVFQDKPEDFINSEKNKLRWKINLFCG